MKTYEVTIIEDGNRKPAHREFADTAHLAAESAAGVYGVQLIGRDEQGNDMFLMRSGVLAVVVEV